MWDYWKQVSLLEANRHFYVGLLEANRHSYVGLLEMNLPYDTVCPLVGPSDCYNFKFHFPCSYRSTCCLLIIMQYSYLCIVDSGFCLPYCPETMFWVLRTAKFWGELTIDDFFYIENLSIGPIQRLVYTSIRRLLMNAIKHFLFGRFSLNSAYPDIFFR